MFRTVLFLFAVFFASGCSGPISDDPFVFSEYRFRSDDSPKIDEPAPQDLTEPNGLLTLRDALSLTLLYNPKLKAYSHEVRAAQARQLQSGLWSNPELEVEVEDIGGTGDLSGFDGAETTIQLSQLIELGGKVQKRRKTFVFDSKLASLDYEAGRLDVSAAMTLSFIELLFVQEKQVLSRELIEIWEETIASVEKRVQAGKDTPLDLSKAQLGLIQARIQDHEIDARARWIRKQVASYWNSREP